MRRFWSFAAVGVAATSTLSAFDATISWPSGSHAFVSLLTSSGTAPSGGFTDGSASWDAVATNCLNAWTPYTSRINLSMTSGTGSASNGNGKNEVIFGSSVFGDPFGDRVLAVTSTLTDGTEPVGVRLGEADIVVNTKYQWNSYRGALKSGVVDLQRVLIHELGHALGLQHPDQADPVQSVSSIMNAVISNIDGLTADDIAAAKFLYDPLPAAPAFATQLSSQSVSVGGDASLAVTLQGSTPASKFPILNYAWFFTPSGGTEEWLFGQKEATLKLGAAQVYDAGSYRLMVITPDSKITSNTVSVSVAHGSISATTRLSNISTRGISGSGAHSLIVGFTITGTGSRRILLRGIGPSLSVFNVSGAVSDTSLTLKDASANTLASNAHWGDTDAVNLKAAFTAAGAFPLADGSKDSALIATLAPGSYTALVTPNNGATEGPALVEAYDLDANESNPSRLSNVSTRGYVDADAGIMIGGFSVFGSGPRSYLIRAAGDSLQQLGVSSGTLDDPTLEIYDQAGNLLRTTDDWDNPAALQDRLRSAFNASGAFAFSDRQESALWLTLAPGNYTVHVKGFGGGKGIGLFEVYETSNPF